MRKSLSKPEYGNYAQCDREFARLLDLYVPKAIKILRGYYKPHVSKVLRKAIMRRSFLKNKANKTKSQDLELPTTEKPSWLNKLEMKRFFGKLNSEKCSSRKFGEICYRNYQKGLSKNGNKIVLEERDDKTEKKKIISNAKNVANIFNKYYNNFTESLDLNK